ncbi:MAG: hypothetical protein ACLR7D_02890 [Lachnospira eligens]
MSKMGLLPDGTMCHIIQLSYNDISLYVSDYGATFQSMFVTDSAGAKHDIILGYDTPEEYYYDPARTSAGQWGDSPTELQEHA